MPEKETLLRMIHDSIYKINGLEIQNPDETWTPISSVLIWAYEAISGETL